MSARWWPTADELARAVAAELDAGDESAALRVLLDGVNALAGIAPDEALAATSTAPDSVGDVRWDTLLAGCVSYRLRRRGLPTPSWARKETLGQWWWPAGEQSLRARTIQRTPIDLKRLAIWFDERNFETA